MSDSDLVRELPFEGAPVTHVLSGYEGKVGKLDTTDCRPDASILIRIDREDGRYGWFPLEECRWTRTP